MIKRTKRLTNIYSMMKQRCYNTNSQNFKYYGGKGVSVCDEWRNNSQAFYDWAMTHGYKDGLTLDRIDNDGNYEPQNCRWVTPKQQGRNRSNNVFYEFNGETKTGSQWCEEYGVSYTTFKDRLERGWTIEQALTITTKGMHQKVFKS